MRNLAYLTWPLAVFQRQVSSPVLAETIRLPSERDRESGQLRATLCRERVKQILPCADASGIWILGDDGNVRMFPLFRGSQELIDHARAVVPRQLSQQDRKRCFLE